MAVSNTDTLIQYAGNNSAVTAYPITFPFDENSWIRCQLLDSTGTISDLVLDTDYTVTGAGGASGNLVTAVAYDNTHQLTIYRVVPLTQLLDLVYNDRLPAALLEAALDKITYALQQIATLGDPGQRTLKFPISEPEANDTTLPVAADRADKLIYFNATNGELELITPAELALTVDPSFEALVDSKADVSALTSKADVSALTDGLALKQNLPQVQTTSFTAAIDSANVTTATATVTDPTPAEGKGYMVFVRNGTTTINAVAYATAGTIIRRIYHSGAWTSYVYYTADALASLAQTLTNKTLTNPVINNISHGFRTQATAAGTTTLVVGDAYNQIFTGSTTQTVALPTTSIAAGHSYFIDNQSTGLVTIQSSGGNTVAVLSAGGKARVIAQVATPTTAANWSAEVSNFISATAATTSGTSFDFTDIPDGVNEIIVHFNSVSLTAGDNFLVQIGDDSTPDTTNYQSITTNYTTVATSTAGYVAYVANAAVTGSGMIVIKKSNGRWNAYHTIRRGNSANDVSVGSGYNTAVVNANIVRVTCTGASTFDAGSVNISYRY